MTHTILVYSQPKKIKLRNISENPKVTLGLDVTDIGRDIIRIDGIAQHVMMYPRPNRQPQYAAKYAERIGAMFGTPRQFAELFSEALIITPSRCRGPTTHRCPRRTERVGRTFKTQPEPSSFAA